MKLFPSLQKRYTKERFTAVQAQRLAQEIAFGPIVFQVSRLMLKFGIFRLLSDNREGLSLEQISQNTGLSKYAAQVLLEASLTIGTVLVKDDQYILAKAGWFLLNDEMAQVNMDFNQDVNYKGLFHLEEALLEMGILDALIVPKEYREQVYALDKGVCDRYLFSDVAHVRESLQEVLEVAFVKRRKTW